MAEIKYLKGKKSGKFIAYYEESEKKNFEVNIVDDKREGKQIDYYELTGNK